MDANIIRRMAYLLLNDNVVSQQALTRAEKKLSRVIKKENLFIDCFETDHQLKGLLIFLKMQ